MTNVAFEAGDLLLWGWLLLASSGFAVVFFAYRLIWRERFRHPSTGATESLTRVRGQVVGRPGTVVYCVGEVGQELTAQPFRVQGKSQSWLVSPSGAVLATRGYRHKGGRVRGLMAGDRVTVDGAITTLGRQESLYRQAGRVLALEAVRIAAGTWPQLRWLRVPLVAAVLVFLFSLGQILITPGPTPRRTRLAQALQDIPDSGAMVSGAGFSFSFRRGPPPTVECVDDQGLGFLIGDQLLGEIHLVDDRLIYQP
jgi:hypothetical protein